MAAQLDHLPTPGGRRIVVGVAGSRSSPAGVEILAALPLSVNDRVVLAMTAELSPLQSIGRFSHQMSLERHAAAVDEARRIAEPAAERLIRLPCDVRTDVRLGPQVDTLRSAVAELRVRQATSERISSCSARVAARASGDVALGSVSRVAAAAARCSVLVAPHQLTPLTGRSHRSAPS